MATTVVARNRSRSAPSVAAKKPKPAAKTPAGEAKRLTKLLGRNVTWAEKTHNADEIASQGHLFMLGIYDTYEDNAMLWVWADDRKGPLAPQFAEEIRALAKEFGEMADQIDKAHAAART